MMITKTGSWIILGLAGLSELTKTESLLLVVLLILSMFFIPVSLHKSVEQIGMMKLFQIPVIAFVTGLLFVITTRRQATWSKRIIVLVVSYAVITSITNGLMIIDYVHP